MTGAKTGSGKTEKIGTDPKEAWTLRSGIRSGEIEDSDPPPVAEPDKGLTIDRAIENYLVEVQATKSPATHRQYKTELEWFRTICDKKYLSDLSRADAMTLFAKRREVPEGRLALNQKTVNRKVMTIIMAMRNQGAVISMRKGDWPLTTDKKIKKYEPEEIAAFFAVCNAEERLAFQVFLATGFREMEVACLYWSDINFEDEKLSVSAKPELGFTPKTYAAHPTKAKCAGGKLNNHFLEACDRETGMRRALNGTRGKEYSSADCKPAAAESAFFARLSDIYRGESGGAGLPAASLTAQGVPPHSAPVMPLPSVMV